jgi:hypothetical protein
MDDPQLRRRQAQLAEAKAHNSPNLVPRALAPSANNTRDPVKQTGAFWQLSYTHNMRSFSRHVCSEELTHIEPLLANFKHLRQLVDRWVDLSIKMADRQTALQRATTPNKP